jgi:hypothetical protein
VEEVVERRLRIHYLVLVEELVETEELERIS